MHYGFAIQRWFTSRGAKSRANKGEKRCRRCFVMQSLEAFPVIEGGRSEGKRDPICVKCAGSE